MFRIKFNLFSSTINLTLKSSLILYLFTLYELIPIIILSIEWITRDDNLLNTFLKYVSAHWHVELINSLISGTSSVDWNINEDFTNTKLSSDQVVSSTNSFITYGKLFYLSDLGLDYKFSKISITFGVIALALVALCIVFVIICGVSNILKTKIGKLHSGIVAVGVNFIYIVLRPLSQILYIIYFNFVAGYLRLNGTSGITSTDEIIFFISIACILILTYLLYFYASNFRYYSPEYHYDPKSMGFDYLLIFMKIVVAVEISLRSYFFTEKLIFSMLLLKVTILATFIYEFFYNKYVMNERFNYLRMGVITFCTLISISKIINMAFDITQFSTIIVEYVFFVFFSIYLVNVKYNQSNNIDFFTNTGDYLMKGNMDFFFRSILKFVMEYKAKRQALKNQLNAEVQENVFMKENLSVLNSHFWNCKIRLNDDKRCPICRVHKKLIVDKLKNGGNMSSSLLNDHLIIVSILKLLTLFETKVYNMHNPLESDLEITVDNKTLTGADFIKNFNIADFFFLKYSVLSILDTNLNRMTLACTLFANKYKQNTTIQIYSRYLKLSMKANYQDVFKDYKILKLEENLVKDYNELLKLYQNFLEDVSIKKVNYSELLGRYLDFGFKDALIKRNLEKLSKSVQMENRLNFIILISIYKYIFNSTYDKYLSQMYDINENIKIIESRYVKDNMLVMDFNLHTNKIKINKVPTKIALKSIFHVNDVDKDIDDFFPNIIRTQESRKLIESCIKNKTNAATINTYFVDKEYFIHRIILNLKIFLTIEKNFKIYATVDFERNKNCFIVDKNGQFCSFSKEFYNNFYIHPKVISKYPGMNIFNFLNELAVDNDGNSVSDLTNKKVLTCPLNLRSYKKNYFRTMKAYENLSNELIYGKIGSEQDFLAQEIENPKTTEEAEYVVYLKQIEKFKIEAEPGLVIMYYFKLRPTKGKSIKNMIEDELDKLDESTASGNEDDAEEGDEENLSQFNFENEASVAHSVDNASVSSVSNVNQKNDETTFKVFNRDAKKFNKYKQNSKDMTRFCYYIVIINVFILVAAVIFLVIVQNNLSFVTNVYNAFQNLMLESWDIYMNVIGLTSFITIKDSQGNFHPNDFASYQYNSTFNKNVTMNLGTFLARDLNIRQTTLNKQIQTTHPYLLTVLPSSFLTESVNIETEIFSISFLERKETTTKIDLFNNIQTFQSIFYSMANQIKYSAVDIINMGNNSTYLPAMIDYLNKNNTDTEFDKNVFLLITNYYRNLQVIIQKVIVNFQDYQYQLVSTVNNILIYGFIILLLMDIAIIYFTSMLLRIYRQQVKLVMTLIYSVEIEFINELTLKIKYINDFLNNLNSPLKSTDHLKTLAIRSRENTNKKIMEKKNQGPLTDEEEDLKKREDADKIKFITDEHEILQKYYSILIILIIVMTAYFSYGFSVFNSKIARMYVRLNLTKYFFAYLTFNVDNFLQLKISIYQNRTDLTDSYFQQKISTDSYIERLREVDDDINYVKVYFMQNTPTLPYLTILFGFFNKDNICPWLSSINDRFYDQGVVEYPQTDYDSTFTHICNSYDMLHTDFFTVMESLKLMIREAYFKYVNNAKDLDTIKGILDSKLMKDLNIIIGYILNPLCDFVVKDVLTPCFERDITILLTNCIIILVVNIIMSIFFLFITQKYILKKTIESVDNLNTLIKILN